jgi:hypothetical protein
MGKQQLGKVAASAQRPKGTKRNFQRKLFRTGCFRTPLSRQLIENKLRIGIKVLQHFIGLLGAYSLRSPCENVGAIREMTQHRVVDSVSSSKQSFQWM